MTGLAVMTVGVSGMTMGVCLNRGLRRFSQMGYDAPLPFVPGFWVPACAGMTWECAGMTGLAVMTGVAGMTWGSRERGRSLWEGARRPVVAGV